MDEMLVRPKYSRPASTPGNKRKQPQTDMMSTLFAVKLLVVVVFLSVFALCKAADTPVTNFYVARVTSITTNNFDTNKYVLKAVTALGIKLPENAALPETGAENKAADALGKAAGTDEDNTAGTDNSGLSGTLSNSEINDSSSSGKTEEQQDPVVSSGVSTEEGSDRITDTINAINQVPVLGETEIKAMADKYAFIFPIMGDIESPFGIRTDPLSGRTVFHSGIDIAANTGTSIKAALAGEVSELGSTPELGKYIKIKHNDGISTVYAYCSLLIAKQGQKVNQGDVIAKVGDTEGMSGSLHFEVWKDGKAADPGKLLNLLNK